MIDYHIHTFHSPDAEGEIMEYCARALSLGLREICFTNHAEMDPGRDDNIFRGDGQHQPISNDQLRRHHEEIRRAAEIFAKKGLTVRSGIEIGFYPGMETRLSELTRSIEYDFWLGSIHCLNHACIDSSREYQSYFSRRPARQLIEEYYAAVLKLVQSRLFDALGHIDVYKKYGIGYYGADIDYLPRDLLTVVFDAVIQTGICLEINTAGLRRIQQFYPAAEIMKMAREQGVKRLTIGSDCHRVDDLGKGIKEGLDYAKTFGFSSVYTFSQRKPTAVKI